MSRMAAAAALVLFTACSDTELLEQQQATLDSVAGISSPAATTTVDTAAAALEQVGFEVRDSLEALVRGPTAEEREAGAESWFSEETAGVLRSVDVDSSGHAIVDFDDLRDVIPNASSSAGSAMLLDELNTTMFAFPHIRSIEYRMEGSCDLFWDWLQYGCQIVDRPAN